MTLHSPHPFLSNEDAREHPCRRLGEDEFLEWCGEKTRAEWVDGDVLRELGA